MGQEAWEGAGGRGGEQCLQGPVTSSGPEEDRNQDPDQRQQQQDPQKDACDANDQALHLALRPGLGAGGLRGRLQDRLCRAGGQGSELGTQRSAPPSPRPTHTVSKPALGQGFQAQGHPQRPPCQPPSSRTVDLGAASSRGGRGWGSPQSWEWDAGLARSLATPIPPCPGGSHPSPGACPALGSPAPTPVTTSSALWLSLICVRGGR